MTLSARPQLTSTTAAGLVAATSTPASVARLSASWRFALGVRALQERQYRAYLCLQFAGTIGRHSGARRGSWRARGPEAGQEVAQRRHAGT